MNDQTSEIESNHLDRRGLLKRLALGAVGAGVGSLGYCYAWEPHWIEVVRRPLRFPNLGSDLVGKTIVQISDLHVGASVDFSYLLRAAERVAEFKPDLIAITGDFMSCDGTEYIDATLEVLGKLPEAPLGCFACPGNHDYGEYFSGHHVANQLTDKSLDVGVRILRNEAVAMGGLQIAGIDDFYAGQARIADAMVQLNYEVPSITLLHNPDLADQMGWGNYSGWILAGHTHGGQCKPPFFGPPILPVRNKRYSSGEIVVDERRTMYINRGLGHLEQIRFNCRPEITVFTLQRT